MYIVQTVVRRSRCVLVLFILFAEEQRRPRERGNLYGGERGGLCGERQCNRDIGAAQTRGRSRKSRFSRWHNKRTLDCGKGETVIVAKSRIK